MSDQGKEKAALAYLLDQIVYSDSYGVHGSDFAACHLCHGGGAPGVPLVHEESCPVARYGDVAQEWWDEQKENANEIERLRSQLDSVTGNLEDMTSKLESARKALEQIRNLDGHHDLPDAWQIAFAALTDEQRGE